MTKEIKIREAMHLIWRNMPDGSVSFSPCKCGRRLGRAGDLCILCAEEELARLTDTHMAQRYVAAVHTIEDLERMMMK